MAKARALATQKTGKAVPEAAHPVSPLAPAKFPALPPLAGVRLATGEAGVRYKNRTDVLLVTLAPGTQAAGVFTKSKTSSAPEDWCRANLKSGGARALVVNSGNANAFTGKAGLEGAQAVARSASATLGCKASEVMLASTGVIGEPLPAERITKILGKLADEGSASAWRAAAEAIMTTDTYPKLATAQAVIDGKRVTINGIAKGSGMIAPDMATMLCFVFTDAKIPADALQTMLNKAVGGTFNATTVDSDTSTSDTVLLVATGQAKHPRVPPADGNAARNRFLADFARKLEEVLLDLALQVVRDGEGAQKLVKIDVTGAVNARSAKRIGMAVANSPLVKTAIAREDANWGRIVMAVGKAGEPADRDLLSVGVGGVWMARDGAVVPGYDEAPVVAHMKGREVEIAIDMGLGKGKATVWTCDLTHGYIDINGSYRS